MYVQNFMKLSAAVHELSTVNLILDTVDFDCEYLWNGSSNQQAENGVMNYDFFHIQWKN